MHQRLLVLIFVVLTLSSQPAAALVRLLATNDYTEAKDMNGYLNSYGLTDIKRLPGFVFEFNSNASSSSPIEIGLRFKRQRLQVGRAGDTSESDYTRLTTWSLPLIARFYLLDKRYVGIDVFGGIGPSWGSLETRKGGVESQYEIAFGDLRYTTLAAASVHVGFDSIYLTFEGGYQWNKIDSLTRIWQGQAGAMNTLDLSGPFVSAGLTLRIGSPSGGVFSPTEKKAPPRPASPPPKKEVAPQNKPKPNRPMPGQEPEDDDSEL